VLRLEITAAQESETSITTYIYTLQNAAHGAWVSGKGMSLDWHISFYGYFTVNP